MTLPSLTDSLVKTALVGTGERAEIDTTTGTMLDSLRFRLMIRSANCS